MYHTHSTTAATDQSASVPIQLACPGCGSIEDLHAVELVEVLVRARFIVENSKPHYSEATELLPDTQHWPSLHGAIVCRNCDLVDLRYGDLVLAVFLTNPTPAAATTAQAPTPGATP